MEKTQKRLGREILIGYAVMALMIVVGELNHRGVLLTAAALRFGLKAYCRRNTDQNKAAQHPHMLVRSQDFGLFVR